VLDDSSSEAPADDESSRSFVPQPPFGGATTTNRSGVYATTSRRCGPNKYFAALNVFLITAPVALLTIPGGFATGRCGAIEIGGRVETVAHAGLAADVSATTAITFRRVGLMGHHTARSGPENVVRYMFSI
jgi:hypothetical protein